MLNIKFLLVMCLWVFSLCSEVKVLDCYKGFKINVQKKEVRSSCANLLLNAMESGPAKGLLDSLRGRYGSCWHAKLRFVNLSHVSSYEQIYTQIGKYFDGRPSIVWGCYAGGPFIAIAYFADWLPGGLVIQVFGASTLNFRNPLPGVLQSFGWSFLPNEKLKKETATLVSQLKDRGVGFLGFLFFPQDVGRSADVFENLSDLVAKGKITVLSKIDPEGYTIINGSQPVVLSY
ncbi:MAG TPA: hypothetical protein VHA52_09160 [Candidatus Babeliaceae bacterium]|nr:hypothetical protein [Candidatus Babeliaceae bacterium]